MKYIVIVGGQLHNKGAQAMTFSVVDEMKKRHPDKEVVLFASVYTERDELEKKKLNFNVLFWPIRAKMKFLGFNTSSHVGITEYIKYLIRGSGKTKDELAEIENILKN